MPNQPEQSKVHEVRELNEGATEAQAKQIKDTLLTLVQIFEEQYGDMRDARGMDEKEVRRNVKLETKDYNFVITSYGSDGGPSIEIYKKNPKKGEVQKMVLQGIDQDAVKVWIDHNPKQGIIGEEVIGSVDVIGKSGALSVDNVAVVLPQLTKFTKILGQATKKMRDEKNRKATSF